MSKLEADIIVVAAGVSGLAACVSAAEKGVKVIAFEKAATTGGTGNMGMGLFGVESRLQRLKQMGPTKEEAFQIFMDHTHWRVDAQLISTYINKSATTIDWLEKMGVEFKEPSAYFRGGWPTWHIVAPGGEGCARNMYKLLTERAKKFGVEFFLQMPVKKIIKKEGKITGVVAENSNGEKIEAQGKAVIIATGGFGDNPKLIKEYTGYTWGVDIQSIRIPGLVGDGMRMAWEVGAAKTPMMMEVIYGTDDTTAPGDLIVASHQPHLLVNVLGERFMNEEVMSNTTFTGNAISAQKDRCAFLVFDENIRKKMEDGFDTLNVPFPFLSLEDFDQKIQDNIDKGNESIIFADSLDELAEKAGINRDRFIKSVERYNQACINGYDDLFYKTHRYLRPIKAPRYYAFKLFPSAYGSLGGIKINYKTEVLDKNWNKIPGLYAAGTDANTIYGDSYVFVLPGNTMGFAVNSGRMAGENAAEYIMSE